jgi:hypothetical protein
MLVDLVLAAIGAVYYTENYLIKRQHRLHLWRFSSIGWQELNVPAKTERNASGRPSFSRIGHVVPYTDCVGERSALQRSASCHHFLKRNKGNSIACKSQTTRPGRGDWYFCTVAEILSHIVICQRIKSGRSLRAPATEREKTPRCQPPESGGMRPVGGKNPPCSLSPNCNSSGGIL